MVRFFSSSDFTDITRLVNNYEGAINEGRVEIYHDGQWGTVCDDGFSPVNAQVVCRELGLLDTDASVAEYGQFGEGSEGEIWLDDVSCDGSESKLSECGHADWEYNNCGHHEDVGVICGGKLNYLLNHRQVFPSLFMCNKTT